MCLNVLRCMGGGTVDKGDSDVEETTGRHAPAEEEARIHPSGNGQHYSPKSTTAAGTHTAHHVGKQQHHEEDEMQEAAATRKDQKEAKRAATTDSGERFHVKANKEESRSEQYLPAAGTNKTNYKESPADQFNVVAGGQPRRGHDHGLRGSAVPAGTATCADRYKTSDGVDAYGNSTYAYEGFYH